MAAGHVSENALYYTVRVAEDSCHVIKKIQTPTISRLMTQ